MSSRNTAYPQSKPPPVSLSQKGLDMITSSGIIFTAHSSQLTAHSSQRKYPLERFLFCNHTHPYFFPVYTHRLTAKALRSQRAVPFLPISTCVQNPKDSAENSAWHNYPLPITHYPLPITHYPLPITHYQLSITHYCQLSTATLGMQSGLIPDNPHRNHIRTT